MRPLVVLRPEPGARASAARAAALGLTVRVHPLFVAEAMAWTVPQGHFDGLLLTSAHAARLAGPLPPLPVHAVGTATATAAEEAGAVVRVVGDGGVDALLDRLPARLRLLHLGGEERIAPVAPRQEIVPVDVYRMRPLAPPPAALLEGTVVLIHSPAAGRRVAALDLRRDRVRIAAISAAAAASCGEGWAAMAVAEASRDGDLLPLAAQLCKEAEDER